MVSLRWVFVFVLGVFLVWWFPFWVGGVAAGWEVCIGFLGEGVLYGGQAYCNQGFIIYAVGFVGSLLTGLEHLWVWMAAVKVALYVVLFVLLRRSMRELGLNRLWLMTMLFLLFVYPYGSGNPHDLLAATLFFTGFHIQFHNLFKGNRLYAGLFYALALYTKYTVLYPVALGFAAELYMKRSELKEAVKGVAGLAAPTVFLAAAVTLMWPSYWTYTVLAQISNPPVSMVEAVQLAILNWNIHALALLAFVLTYAILLVRGTFTFNERMYLMYPMVCLPLVAASISRAWERTEFASYYGLPLYALVVVSLLLLREKKRLFFVAVAALLLYPGFTGGGPTARVRGYLAGDEVGEVREMVSSGLTVLPPPEKGLLYETGVEEIRKIKSAEYFRQWGWSVPDYTLLSVGGTNLPPEDPYWGPRIRELIDVKYGLADVGAGLSPQQQRVKEDVIAGRYDVLMYTPRSWVTTSAILAELPEETLRQYCEVAVPDFSYLGDGRTHSIVIYANRSRCASVVEAMASHYGELLPELCEKSEEAAYVVRNIMARNKVYYRQECSSGAEVGRDDVYEPRLGDLGGFLALAAVLHLLTARNIV